MIILHKFLETKKQGDKISYTTITEFGIIFTTTSVVFYRRSSYGYLKITKKYFYINLTISLKMWRKLGF